MLVCLLWGQKDPQMPNPNPNPIHVTLNGKCQKTSENKEATLQNSKVEVSSVPSNHVIRFSCFVLDLSFFRLQSSAGILVAPPKFENESHTKSPNDFLKSIATLRGYCCRVFDHKLLPHQASMHFVSWAHKIGNHRRVSIIDSSLITQCNELISNVKSGWIK